MASLIRSTHAVRLPASADIVEYQGKPHVRVTEQGRKVLHPLTADGKRYLKPLKKWYGQYADHTGKTVRVPLATNKTAAQQMLADLVKNAEQRKAGLGDPFADHRERPLDRHLSEWKESLRSNGRVEAYIQLKVERVQRVLSACTFTFARDLDAIRFERHLGQLRDTNAEPLQRLGEFISLTLDAAAAATGMKATAFSASVRRHQLQASGQGKARRFPRETIEAVLRSRPQGLSLQTVNHIADAVKAFTKWLVEHRRLERNPFLGVKKSNVQLDVRHRRGELTTAEVSMLLSSTRASGCDYRGLSCGDRAMLYEVALGTGFRRSELASLTPAGFHLDADVPTIALPAKATKNRRKVVQPISRQLAERLKPFLAGIEHNGPVWPGSWCERSSDMLKADLRRAGIPYDIATFDGTEHRDFHALRATCISNIIRSGATIKEAMVLARHSDPKLTASRYARTQLSDLNDVVNRTTGTPTMGGDHALKHAQARDTGCDPVRVGEGDRPNPGPEQECDKPQETKAFAGLCGPMMVDNGIAPGANRTHDPQFRKPVLYPLSYGGDNRHGTILDLRLASKAEECGCSLVSCRRC